jgi:hypothetical protein
MSIKNSIVTNGLTFYYDMFNDKSFRGAPSTNYCEGANPDVNSTNGASGDDWSQSQGSTGRFAVNHHDAIRVFNKAGGEITYKLNTGVQNWRNTYHGIWTFEEELQQPVVTMRDIGDGSWMYAGFGLPSESNTPTNLGVGLGDNYVISWDQWTTNTSKSANCGLYGQNTTGTQNNFHDGLSNSSGTGKKFNTKTHTWERLWCVYTISANRGLNATWSQYNYGHYGGRGITKVANWQLEVGNTPSKYIRSQTTGNISTRTNTESIVDLSTAQRTITQNNLVYSIENTTDMQLPERFSFDGTNSYLSFSPIFNPYNSSYSLEAWIKRDATGRNDGIMSDLQFNWLNFWVSSSNKLSWKHGYYNTVPAETRNELIGVSDVGTDWTHVAVTFENGVGAKLYINGVLDNSNSNGNPFGLTGSRGVQFIGTIYNSSPGGTNGLEFDGQIAVARIYNRNISQTEILQNFNASRGNYGV